MEHNKVRRINKTLNKKPDFTPDRTYDKVHMDSFYVKDYNKLPDRIYTHIHNPDQTNIVTSSEGKRKTITQKDR